MDQKSIQRDNQAAALIRKYSYGATGAMIAIPIPGLDMAATYAVWGKMIFEIAKVYGEPVTMTDAKALATELFNGVILTTVAWFASAKTASTILKFIPGVGTVAAYLIDATVCAFGAKKITTALGFAAATYFKAGKKMDSEEWLPQLAGVLKNPKTILSALRALKK